jgi:two-component system CheB/CheR fusion protein
VDFGAVFEISPATMIVPDAHQESANREPPSAGRVVGIGASAGGLESLEHLFSALPADTGMAFVVVQHLSSRRSIATSRR